MSGRRRRSETVWDNKEEKRRSTEFHSNVSPRRSQNWSKSEVNDDLMHANFSRSPSWDTIQGNGNGPTNDDISRGRNRMYSDSPYDGWDQQQHSNHPSDDGYGMTYRSRDKGGNARMSRERVRERSRSPNRSRSRSRDGRSSRENTRGYRHETNASYRGGGNNITENWSRRSDYKDGSRFNDYPHRTAYDDHRNTRIPCRYFAAGHCNRDNCRFSHDDVKLGGFDETSRQGRMSNDNNNNTSWDDKKKLSDGDVSRDASGFHDVGKSHLNLDNKKRSWDGPTSWDDVKSGGFDETSRQAHTSDANNNNTWDCRDDKKKLLGGRVSRDSSSFHDVGKSRSNLDNKKRVWDGPPSWDDVKSGGFDETSRQRHTFDDNNTWESRDDKKRLLDGHVSRDAYRNLDNKKRSWDGPTSWDDAKSGGFDETSRLGHTSNDNNNNNNTWDHRDDKNKLLDEHAPGFHNVGKSYPNLDNKKRSWDGPTSWDDVGGSGFSGSSDPFHKHEDSVKDSLNDNNTKFGRNIDRNRSEKWDGPLWGDSGLNNIAPEESDLDNIVPEDTNQHVLTSGKDSIQSGHDMSTRSHSYLNRPEQNHMLLSNPLDGPLNAQIQGTYVHMENVSQPQAFNNVNEASLTSQLAPQANAPFTETSHKEQLPQIYKDLHLTNAIDYIKSLPNSAYNQDTRAKEEIKISVPMGMLSGSVTQQNQEPADLTLDSSKVGPDPTHESSKAGQMGIMEKKIVEGFDKKVGKNSKKEEKTNLDKFEARGKVEEGDNVNDEKAMRQFKVGLVEFVKEILKPKWKEGKMSREVHKAVVKKVVEKVTTTIQGTQIPRTQSKIEQYLAYSKSKITKLAEAYMERLLKA